MNVTIDDPNHPSEAGLNLPSLTFPAPGKPAPGHPLRYRFRFTATHGDAPWLPRTSNSGTITPMTTILLTAPPAKGPPMEWVYEDRPFQTDLPSTEDTAALHRWLAEHGAVYATPEDLAGI